MKKFLKLIASVIAVFSLSGCDMIDDIMGKDTDTIHRRSYDAITGKFVLSKVTDKRITNLEGTYFEFDGSKGNFALKYYVNGELKKEGNMSRILTYEDRIGQWCTNLHINVKIGDISEHISSYTESFSPLNQFRIIEEYYTPGDEKYYYSELPYVMGTYVREGEEFVEEQPCVNQNKYIPATLDNFTSAIDGKFQLDENHYFYFVNPKAWATPNGSFLDSYFQYYSSSLEKPIEGFVFGFTIEGRSKMEFKTLRDSIDWGEGSEGRIRFGYYTFDEKDNMIHHPGYIDFSNGVLNSFTFEHLSRDWTDQEWDAFTKDKQYQMPDPILYDFVGGTYTKVVE